MPPDPRRRRGPASPRADQLDRREALIAAREREFGARRRWRRAWWALRLAPWTTVELVVASWLVLAALLDLDITFSAAFGGTLVAAVATARLLGWFSTPLDKPPPGR